jgi:hypothetical protein
MTEPDEALIWAIESWGADKARRNALTETEIEAGVARADALLPDHDGMDKIVVLNRAFAYRAGEAASAERIKALEEALAKANKPRWFYADEEGSPFDSAHEAVEWILDEFGPDDDFPNGKGVRRIDTMRDCAPIFAAVRCRRITEAERAGGRKGDFVFDVTECATEAEAEALLKEADQ